MPIPPRKKPTVRQMLMPKIPADMTETRRQGQGIGDIQAIGQMARTVIPEVLRNTPGTSVPMAGYDALQAGRQGNMTGAALAALGAIPFAGAMKYADEAGDIVRALPMDEASRMARAAEQGFALDVYHGTRSTRPFDEFRPQMGPQRHDLPGVHVGTKEAAQKRLEQYFGENNFGLTNNLARPDQAASIMPLKMKAERPFVKKGGTPYTEAEIRQKVTAFARKEGLRPDSYDAKIRFRNSLLEQGYDVVPYVNTVEDRGSISYLVLRPENLRSRFAKFDPANIGKAGLMGGMAGLLGVGAAQRAKQEPEL